MVIEKQNEWTESFVCVSTTKLNLAGYIHKLQQNIKGFLWVMRLA